MDNNKLGYQNLKSDKIIKSKIIKIILKYLEKTL